MIDSAEITGLVLAGGRGSRMGGVDKGLQTFNGTALALHTLRRLQLQTGRAAVNANRNLATYESFGVPVLTDALADYPGPLAGFLTGLEQCETPYLVTAPCDTPLFPADLVARLAQALDREQAEIAMAAGRDAALPAEVRTQPVFCLLRAALQESLVRFIQDGGRKIDTWTGQHKTVVVPFDSPNDDPRAFFNANTLAELHSLERS